MRRSPRSQPPREPARQRADPPGLSRRISDRHRLRRPGSRSRPQLLPRQGLPRRPLQRRAAVPGGRRPGPGRSLRPRQRGGPGRPLRRSRHHPGEGGLRSLPDDPARRDPAGQGREAAGRPPRRPRSTRPTARRWRSTGRSPASGATCSPPPMTPSSTPPPPSRSAAARDLAFKPKLAFRLFGGTHRGSHPKLRATLTMPAGRRQHRQRLGRPAALRVPRPGPHRHRLHQGAVRRRSLSGGLDLRHARRPRRRCSTKPCTATSTCAPQATSCPTWSPPSGRQDRCQPGRPDRLGQRRHPQHLRIRPRRPGRSSSPSTLAGRQEGPPGQLPRHLQGPGQRRRPSSAAKTAPP